MSSSAAFGVAAGLLSAWLWLWVVPWAVHRDFFAAMSSLTREVLRAEEIGSFLVAYKDLLAKTAAYVGRNLIGTLVAGVPLAAMFFIVDIAQAAFIVPFVASMMVVFCWPRLWPAAKAY
jgi:hypothetical protein